MGMEAMGDNCYRRAKVEAAIGAIAADGCFCLAFLVHLMGRDCVLGITEYMTMGIIVCVFLTSCWLIYDDYWLNHARLNNDVVKKLRIRELQRGASIEFDGKQYLVDDIHLPIVDGYEVANHLKRHPVLRQLPLVAVTALAMVGDREKVLSAGFDGYIGKPIEPEKFVGQIEAFLKKKA